MFKVNNSPSVSIVNFEQVNTGWVARQALFDPNSLLNFRVRLTRH